jgi:hypothetical protein
VIILICASLTIALLAYIFYPERQVASQTEKTRLEFLRERKDVLYENLRDLNFEYRAGKYREEEYASERAVMENEAAEVVSELERLDGMRR